MKRSFTLLLTLLSISAVADVDLRDYMPTLAPEKKSLGCRSGEGGVHVNPDNTPGGFVAKTAKVEAGATVSQNAQVCEFAQIKAGAKILGQAVIRGRAQISSNVEVSGFAQVMGEARVSGGVKISGSALIDGSPQISGATQISGLAKIEGGSKIHNALICQASRITNFDVIDSDYYCQTEDPEPPHPGELGKKTLLGVDTDIDGVRDDVEIWINASASNKPNKDNTNIRMALKQIARDMTFSLKSKNAQQKAVEAYKKQRQAQKCLSDLGDNQTPVEEMQRKILKIFYNTMPRLDGYVEMKTQSAGEEFEVLQKKFVTCSFTVK